LQVVGDGRSLGSNTSTSVAQSSAKAIFFKPSMDGRRQAW